MFKPRATRFERPRVLRSFVVIAQPSEKARSMPRFFEAPPSHLWTAANEDNQDADKSAYCQDDEQDRKPTGKSARLVHGRRRLLQGYAGSHGGRGSLRGGFRRTRRRSCCSGGHPRIYHWFNIRSWGESWCRWLGWRRSGGGTCRRSRHRGRGRGRTFRWYGRRDWGETSLRCGCWRGRRANADLGMPREDPILSVAVSDDSGEGVLALHGGSGNHVGKSVPTEEGE